MSQDISDRLTFMCELCEKRAVLDEPEHGGLGEGVPHEHSRVQAEQPVPGHHSTQRSVIQLAKVHQLQVPQAGQALREEALEEVQARTRPPLPLYDQR